MQRNIKKKHIHIQYRKKEKKNMNYCNVMLMVLLFQQTSDIFNFSFLFYGTNVLLVATEWTDSNAIK